MHIVCIENITRGGQQGLFMTKQTLLHKLPLHELNLQALYSPLDYYIFI